MIIHAAKTQTHTEKGGQYLLPYLLCTGAARLKKKKEGCLMNVSQKWPLANDTLPDFQVTDIPISGP